MLLRRRRLNEEKEADKKADKVEEALTTAYEKFGFKVWVLKTSVKGEHIRVMGKQLDPIPA